jgi:hypothetical protein
MRTARSLQRSCRAISPVLVNRPAISPASQRRAFAIAASSRARVSARMGRRSAAAAGGPTIARLRRLAGADQGRSSRFRLGMVRKGKRDPEPARPDNDSGQALTDELALAQVLIRTLVRVPEGLEDDGLDFGGWHARHRAGLMPFALGPSGGRLEVAQIKGRGH